MRGVKMAFAAAVAAAASAAAQPGPPQPKAAATAASPAGTQSFYMGIDAQGHPEGPLISNVAPGGTAAAMGLKVGDIVLELNGKPISEQVVQEHEQRTKVGDQVSMKVKREGAIVELTGKAMGRPAAAAKPAGPLAAPTSAAVVSNVRKIIAERYVLPERRPALDAVLAEGLSSGRYGVSDPKVLAERISADLKRVGRDEHLNFRYDPRQAEIMGAEQNEGDPAAMQLQVRARNHGVAELRVLPGNIRYMDYRGFDWIGPESRAALNAALQFLSGGEAVIIDLRRNGGGFPMAVQHLISHFVEADTPLTTYYMNGSATPDTIRSLRELQVPRMVSKPLYVLTSGGTGSAAEGFAGHVGGYRLGEVVGETTAGAGFRNDLLPIEGGFILSVSIGRAVLASTGKDWEAVGIKPTIATPAASALDVAHAHALRRIASTASGQERVRLEAMADALGARHDGRAAALPLAAYLGSYGDRTILLEGERLAYQRGTGPREILIPVGGNRFVLESDPGIAVGFAPSGAPVTTMLLGPVGGPMQGRFERTR